MIANIAKSGKRAVRNPRKYFEREFWRIALTEAWFRGKAAALYTLPSHVRTLSRRPQCALVLPAPMDRYQFAETYVAWKVLAACDLRIARQCVEAPARVGLAWQPATTYDLDPSVFTSLPTGARVLNGRCTDISKSHVGECFQRIFGYRLEVDPLTYHGPILRKLETNGKHDIAVLDGPLAKTDPGYIYQRLITYATPEGNIEWRVFVVDSRAVAVYALTAPRDDRFAYRREYATMTTVDATFTSGEQERISAFCRTIGLDFGVLDVLRDGPGGPIYIADCNNTPTGPSPTLPIREQIRLVHDLAEHFKRAYLSEAPV